MTTWHTRVFVAPNGYPDAMPDGIVNTVVQSCLARTIRAKSGLKHDCLSEKAQDARPYLNA